MVGSIIIPPDSYKGYETKLCRGIAYDKRAWVTGLYFRKYDSFYHKALDYIQVLQADTGRPYAEFVVISASIGKDTGKTDKHEQSIFEGDIVRFEDALLGVRDAVVYYSASHAAFILTANELSLRLSDITSQRLEIIGSIHDKLLRKEDNYE